MPKRKALFFLRHYNDIDHIVPVIYKWLSIGNVPIDVVITTRPDYLNDYRIRFLQKFEGLQVRFIDEFGPEGKTEDESPTSSTKRGRSWYDIGFVGRRIMGPFRGPKPQVPAGSYHPPSYDVSFVAHMLNAVFGDVDRGIVVFDWTYTDFARTALGAAKDRGFTTISLPHGDAPYYNRMEQLNDLNYSSWQNYQAGTIFDYTVVPNGLCARRYQPYLEPDRLKILGSPRYNDEWLDIMSKLVPEYDAAKGRDNLKIVFFLRQINYPVFWDEVMRTMKLVLQFPEVYLAVRHHTRSASVQKTIQAYPELNADNVPNLEFLYDEPGGTLIQWADVVLDMGTSVTFEAMKRGKPVLAMEYLHSNRSTVAHYMKSCDIQCRDDLYDWIERFSQDRKATFYDETERQRFIAEMIDVPDANVLPRYVEFLESCF